MGPHLVSDDFMFAIAYRLVMVNRDLTGDRLQNAQERLTNLVVAAFRHGGGIDLVQEAVAVGRTTVSV